MKCVIYLRTSTQDQKEKKTIEAQRRECQKYAESQKWEIVETISDEAMSGSFTENRLGWQAVKEIMVQGKTEIVLVPELSRITRTSDLRERGDILQTFIDCKVNLATPSRGIIDLSEWQNELLTGIELSIARQERETTAKRMRRGRLAKLEQGQYCYWSIPYGLKRRSDKNVKPVKHYVEKHPDEYPVMRTIYDKIVVEGLSLHDAVVYLNDTGIKTRRGKRWQVANLSHMLKKDSLTGTIVANRHIHQMTAEGSRRVLDKNGKPMFRPKEEWISVPVPAIYTKKEYKALRQRLEENRCGNPKRNKPDDPFWLKGKLRCGLCGAMYGAKPTSLNYYMCGDRSKLPKHRAPGEEKCLAPVVNADVIHHLIEKRLLMRLLLRPEVTLKEWLNVRSNKTAIKQAQLKLTSIVKRIEKVDQQQERLLDQALSEMFPADVLENKANNLKQAKRVIVSERENVQQHLDALLEAQANRESMGQAVTDLKALSRTLPDKIKAMTSDQRKRLIGHYIPTYLEIFPIGTLTYGRHGYRSEPYTVTVRGKPYKVNWEYSLPIIRNLDDLVQALKECLS